MAIKPKYIRELYPYTKELESNVNLIGKLDFIFAKAHYSLSLHCTTPEINSSKVISGYS